MIEACCSGEVPFIAIIYWSIITGLPSQRVRVHARVQVVDVGGNAKLSEQVAKQGVFHGSTYIDRHFEWHLMKALFGLEPGAGAAKGASGKATAPAGWSAWKKRHVVDYWRLLGSVAQCMGSSSLYVVL